MTISERMLRKWRIESLRVIRGFELTSPDVRVGIQVKDVNEFHGRILHTTQELLDQHLIRKSKGGKP